MVDNEPIQNARMLIQQCIELVELEPQQDFLQLRLITDLNKALESLEAVQTVVLAPQKGVVPHTYPLGVKPPPVVDLLELDEGEPVSYEVDCEPYGMRIIRESDRATIVVGKPPRTLSIPFKPQEVEHGNENESLD